MPKVGKTFIRAGNHSREFEIYYSRKVGGFYFKDFPKEWENVVNSTDSDSQPTTDNPERFRNRYASDIHGHDTEGQLLSDAQYLMRRYYEITAVTKKMILVRHSYGRKIRMEQTGIGNYISTVGGVSGNVGFSEEIKMEWAVGFEWEVIILTYGTKQKYFQVILDDNYKEIQRSSYASELQKSDGDVIDWTPERHEFFKGLEKAMNEMANKMHRFFKDKDKMIALIDSNGFKLLNDKQDENKIQGSKT